MTGFSVESLTNGIEACKKNIKTFEDAIEKERATIREYHDMIDTVVRKEREARREKEILAQMQVEVVRDGDKE